MSDIETNNIDKDSATASSRKESTKSKGTKQSNRKRNWIILLINLAAMAVVGIILIWLLMAWLGRYTRHNSVVVIPDITNMQVDEAEQLLSKDHLYLLVTDSIYDESKKPGVIIDTSPIVGASIKRDRTIFVRINAISVMKRQIPDVHDKSMRQAQVMLEANGFNNVTIKYVPGTYNDLALYVKTTSGRVLNPGDIIPYNQPLILEISSNDRSLLLGDSLEIDTPQLDEPIHINSTEEDDNKEEGWF